MFHNDIKSSATSNCTNHSAIKPGPAAASNEDSATDHHDENGLICLNPFHYEVTAEAEARFLKQGGKTSKKSKICDNKPAGEVFEDDGTDYIKLWDESATNPDDGLIDFDEDQMFEELKIVEGTKDKKFVDVEQELIKKLKIREELSRLVFSGKYVDAIRDSKSNKSKLDTEKKSEEIKPVTGTLIISKNFFFLFSKQRLKS